MREQAPANLDYRSFFEEQRRKTEQLDRQRVIIAAAIAAALLILLIALGSPWLVYGYVGLLYAVTYWGLFRLHAALRVTKIALGDLERLAEFLSGELHTREEVQKFVQDQIKPDDSNVPEALAALSQGSRSGESIRAAANAAFAQPASELTLAQFFRTALVLGGLFGTVLFFAFQLDDAAVLQGNLNALLPGLRGALACTLTGILGSVALGFVASRIDQTVERCLWETESLLGGPFSQALLTRKDDTSAVNEVQLWQMLLREVAELRRGIEDRHVALGNDISAHAVALQELSTQLAELPPVQVPPQLAKLQDVVSDFRSSMEILHKTTGTLVDAVGKVGIAAPIKMLEHLEAIRPGVTAAVRDVQTVAERVDEIQSAIGEQQGSVASGFADVAGRIAGVQNSTGVLRDILTGFETQVRGLGQELNSTRADLRLAIEEIGKASPPQHEGSESSAQSASVGDPLTDNETVSVERLNLQSVLKQNIADLSALLAEHTNAVTSLTGQLYNVFRPNGPIDEMAKWHQRAARAPLMKFLLLPFRPIREEGGRGT